MTLILHSEKAIHVAVQISDSAHACTRVFLHTVSKNLPGEDPALGAWSAGMLCLRNAVLRQ